MEDFEENKDARLWATMAHLGGFCTYTGIPFAGVLAPLLVWMMKREEFAFVDDQGKEALNFQITMSIAEIVCIALSFFCIGFFLLIPLLIVKIVFMILGAVSANKGVPYRYPMTLRLVT